MSNRLKIIALSNFRYREVALNWARHVEKIGIENYEVIGLDGPVRRWLKNVGGGGGVKVGRAHPHPVTYDLKRGTRGWLGPVKGLQIYRSLRGIIDAGLKYVHIWKLLVVRDLLKVGYDVVTSDLDALWLKNPVEDLFLGNSSDIVVSTAHGSKAWPERFREKYGYVLCNGWAAFRSNPEVINYLDRLFIAQRKEWSSDDQVAFNSFLMDERPDVRKSDLGDVFVAGGVEILALNEHLVKRGAFSPETYVWHPNVPSSPEAKKYVLQEHDCWLV